MLNIDPIGITSYAIGIEGKSTQWSWKCKCGMWQSEYFYRYQCQNDYREHCATCEAHLTKRALDDGYCVCAMPPPSPLTQTVRTFGKTKL